MFLQASIWPTLTCDPTDGAFNPSQVYVPATTTYGQNPNFGGSASIDIQLQSNPESDMYRRTIPAYAFPSNGTLPSFPACEGDYYEIAQPGVNFNLCPFPLQSLCNSMTCSINDCSVTTNGDTLQEQILLTNTRDTQRIRTTPSKFDQYAWNSDDVQSTNGNMSTFNLQRPAVGEVPTGAWPITFYNPVNGSRLLDDPNNCGAYIDPVNRQAVYYINGRPILIPGGVLQGAAVTLPAATAITCVDDPGSGSLTGTATLTFGVSNAGVQGGSAAQSTLVAGSQFMITGLVGAQAIWNGYYVVSTSVMTTATSFTITFKYGAVVNSAGVFVKRSSVTVGGSGSGLFYVTSDRLPNGAANLFCQPINTVSQLLGQILPSGVQIMPSAMNLPITTSFLYQVAEPMVMSPFIYQDALEFNNVGLYGCTNIQFTMNIQTPSPNCQSIQQGGWPTSYAPFSVVRTNCDYPAGGNILRTSGVTGAFSGVTLTAPANTPTTTGAFLNPRMVVQFLTPGPDVSLPLISNVPYMEFPRYTNSYLVSDPRATQYNIQSQTITLSSIPDFIMCYVKARTRCQLQNETYVPIQRVAVTFDNFSNLCSNMTQYELYTCSVAAGLDMDYQTWKGYANASGRQLTNGSVQSGVTSGQRQVWGGVNSVTIAYSADPSPNWTYTVYYRSNNPQWVSPVSGQPVLITGIDGEWSFLNGLQTCQSGTSIGYIVFGPSAQPPSPIYPQAASVTTPIALGGGTITIFNSGSSNQVFNTTVPVSTASWNLGGSKVPYQTSTGTGDLWPQSSGLFNVAGQNKFVPRATTQLTGGPLMLRMGQDVSLSPGLAPGTLGNFSIQLNLTLDNSQHFFDAYSSYQLTIIAVNSGYFETVRGQSAVRKTILNMADVESASVSTGVTTAQLRRLVGGARGGTLSSLGMHMSRHPYGMEGGARKRQHTGSGL